MLIPKTAIREIGWPAIPDTQAASMLALQYQLNDSQWWSSETIKQHQFLQLQKLIQHAYTTVPYYTQHFDQAGFSPPAVLTEETWASIPVLTRSQVQQAGKNLCSSAIPKSHGNLSQISTSGSTGKSIKVFGTNITGFFWQTMTLRDHLWHQRDLAGKLAVIRLLPEGAGTTISNTGWGPSTDKVYDTGSSVAITIKSTISQQVEWLLEENPHYLLTYPSNVLAIAQSLDAGMRSRLTNLRQVRTLGETVSDHIRQVCREAFGVPLVDMYTCQEAGYLALQCPAHDHYHVQSENVLLEVLDENNNPCQPGQVGRVVITTLHNFASPLIRYDIGDYAEAGYQCDCGRGLPVLKRVMGRVRNLLTMPTGEKVWPVVGSNDYADIAPIRQFQFIQKSVNDIDVKFVAGRSLTEAEERQLINRIQSALGHPFNLNIIYVDDIPRSPGGKFEDFISEV